MKTDNNPDGGDKKLVSSLYEKIMYFIKKQLYPVIFETSTEVGKNTQSNRV